MEKPARQHLKMDLIENAYDSLNESLLKARAAETDPKAWKFAILHIVQAIELMLKESLRRQHPLLIFESVDRAEKTVSLSLALERLQKRLNVALNAKDVQAVHKAMKLRHEIQHYEFKLPVLEQEGDYALLLEFAETFHAEHLGGELHKHIRPDLWDKEADLMEFFRRETVPYNGHRVLKSWPAEIRNAQLVTKYELADGLYDRIRYGSEYEPNNLPTTCHDCSVLKGEFHVPWECDMERCPRCGGQFITCACQFGETEPVDVEPE